MSEREAHSWRSIQVLNGQDPWLSPSPPQPLLHHGPPGCSPPQPSRPRCSHARLAVPGLACITIPRLFPPGNCPPGPTARRPGPGGGSCSGPRLPSRCASRPRLVRSRCSPPGPSLSRCACPVARTPPTPPPAAAAAAGPRRPRLFRSRDAPPTTTEPQLRFCSGLTAPPPLPTSAPAAVPIRGPPAPLAVPARRPPPRRRHAPWAPRCEFAAGGGARRNSRLPSPRRRSPSRASKIVCAILEPPPLESEAGLREHCGSRGGGGGGGGGAARGRPPSSLEPLHHTRKPGMARGTPSIPGLPQPHLDNPVIGHVDPYPCSILIPTRVLGFPQ